MTKKRVHEIAKEQGLSSKELLEKLKAAGVQAKAAASAVEEADALRALAGNGASGDGSATTAAVSPAAAAPATGAPAAAANPQPGPAASATPHPAVVAQPAAADTQADGAAQPAGERVRPTRDSRTGERAPGGAGPGGRRRVVIDSQASRRQQGGPSNQPVRRPRRGRRRRGTYDETIAPIDTAAMEATDLIRVNSGSTVKDVAEYLGVPVPEVIKKLMVLGEMATLTQTLSDDAILLIASEFDKEVEIAHAADDVAVEPVFEDVEEDLVERPPVVTIMGHVDHGKTSILDAIRQAKVAAGEAGGITQRVGAYQVEKNGKPITFIDTPGHEAFTAMRARGAKSTDIAVLVVAADDGVMPQTIEALNHARAAEVPIVVAVNKVDKPTADPVKVRGQLTEFGLIPEEYGGDTMFVDVSATARTGLAELLEAIVLTADAELDLRANPDMPAQGVAIEAHLDRGRGPVATVLVHRGTLHVGDSIVAGSAYGRVRAMINDQGDTILEAPPSTPVQVLGLTSVSGAGDNFLVVEDDRKARQIAERRESRMRAAMLAKGTRRKTLDQLFEQLAKGEVQELKLILKGDTAGSVEALEDELLKIEVGDDVSVRIIDRGVGAITETNVTLASASDAVIIGYNVRPQGKATELADREGVDIRYYSVIYQAIDEVEAALKGMLKPVFTEEVRGQAQIREIFRSSKIGVIAGCMVIDGTIRRHAKARLLRDSIVVAETDINTLRREKDDVTEVRDGFECGLTLHNYSDLHIGDIIETFEMVEKPRV